MSKLLLCSKASALLLFCQELTTFHSVAITPKLQGDSSPTLYSITITQNYGGGTSPALDSVATTPKPGAGGSCPAAQLLLYEEKRALTIHVSWACTGHFSILWHDNSPLWPQNWRVTILGNVLTRQTKVRGLKAGSVTQSEC